MQLANHKQKAMRSLRLTDPRFNLKEIIKQMLLLEQHLCEPAKRCPDCILKHMLTIEALAEEAVQLDRSGRFAWMSQIAQASRNMQDAYLSNPSDLVCRQIGVLVRNSRKPLCQVLIASL